MQPGGPPAEPAEAAPRRWSLVLAFGGWLVGTLLAGVIAGVVVAVTGRVTLGLGALALTELGLWAGLLGAPLLASRRQGSGHVAADFGLHVRRADLGVGVVTGLASQLVLVPFVYTLLQPLIGRRDVSGPARELTSRARGPGFLALAVALVLVAPVVEELFFRGLVLGALRARLGDGWAVALSALAFGAAHLEALQLPALVALGVVLGALAVRTRRLGAGIVAHGVFNLITVIALASTRR